MSKSIFDNTEVAFKTKSNAELRRAYFLFKLIGRQALVNIGTAFTLFALKIRLPIKGIVRATVFNQFCAGETEQEAMPVIDILYNEGGVYSVLDYSVEGQENEESFDLTTKKINELTVLATKNKAMPFSVFKPTGIGRFDLWAKVSAKETLTKEEEAEWQRIRDRYDSICATAHKHDIILLIDAEHSWIQDAADELCEEMMEKYNKEKPIVYNTLQCYRWDRLDYLKAQHKRAREKGFKIGHKIVRGAYLELENERAIEMSYPTPICASKQETDEMFDSVLLYILDNLDDIHLFCGTHNENSSLLATEEMDKRGIARNDNRIWFGQLYGMSDNISFNLAEHGYNTAKYLPFGPIEDVMPYLIRRAEENTSVAGQSSRELSLITKERKRRKNEKN
ncbi:MAG TPA: proline dehydrogenase family protein [Flavobacteriaceae bacterium]|nr:proline dehydrogenase family protein [Flavobacteriaceae bacterium]